MQMSNEENVEKKVMDDGVDNDDFIGKGFFLNDFQRSKSSELSSFLSHLDVLNILNVLIEDIMEATMDANADADADASHKYFFVG